MNARMTARVATFVATVVTSVAISACDGEAKSEAASAPPGPSASTAKPASSVAVVNGLPLDDAIVRQAVNPKGVRPYSGPTGAVTGTVVISGDDSPPAKKVEEKIPESCAGAAIRQAKLFETGAMGTLADVLVTVTGYDAYIPAKQDAVTVEAKGCVWSQRTIPVTFGQRLEIVSKDGQPYIPRLLGGKEKAMLVAIPGGDSIRLHPVQPGRYVLSDNIKSFMEAEVLVVKYATFDVTGKNGRYEISGIPAGQEVTVTAFLPAIMKSTSKKVKLAAGATEHVDFSLKYERPPEKPAGAPDKPIVH